ncbi:hypothetical protein VOLCADRAFT_93811 [Volvox carteri f. nagariensis]|uniref:CRAL-TRIO domain-containing protein n=1 Tax=Volvox carteri f. nagariensis TaxID=3068 RepID=D8U345_VOLCA|nr:uncharacterized protein VOLCADRAFT_93811 [Volvox carteri f. nagariensis]EFJ46012.1 hypothetical protein VOLCADRAFT_93811 [Volvox carteri f. nagariensis]|eukprot:XP_002953090.1 hypothetical protein VOLCADRAFT_93811 [Volvox carteri f. nagariensis]
MEQDQQQNASLQASPSGLSHCAEPLCWSASSTSDASASSSGPTPDGITADQINHVRNHLESGYHADDTTVKRFIRATGGNLALSAKRLNATLAWRAKVRPEEVVCRACAREPKSHYMHLAGFCRQGRPIIYSCLELATNKVFEDNRDHMIQTFEMAVKCMPPGVEQWIWVCDFKGFGVADANPKLAKLFLEMSGEHYPERLGLFLVVDAPSLFGMLWKAISHFVDPKTYKKIRFLPFDAARNDVLSKSRLKAEMDLHFDPVTTAWFLREMNENRDKAKSAKKFYNIYSIYEQALEGQLCDGHEHKYCCHGHLATITTSTRKQPSQPSQVPPLASAASSVDPGVADEGGQGAVDGQSVSVHASSGTSAAATAAAGRLGSGATAGGGGTSEAAALHIVGGTPALLHTFNMNPELLLPQATATV